MGFSWLLTKEIQDFVVQHYNQDVNQLTLKYKSKFENWDLISHQIIGKLKSKKKLPTWFKTKNIVFPLPLSIEQSSSEETAKYKSGIVSGKTLIDLTGGLGVDDYYFAKVIDTVTHCEINTDLSDVVSHNSKAFSVDNIIYCKGNSLDYLTSNDTTWDWMYIDPARRDDTQNKVFLFEDCIPNIIEHENLFHAKAKNILIKTSPIFDLTEGFRKLKNIKSIHIVAVNNEVKELLWEITPSYQGEIHIKTINLKSEKNHCFDFAITDKESTNITYSPPLKFLYEPNAAIMKSGGYDLLSKKFHISKLHQHSHLFTSEEITDFPGRTFEITNVIPYNKKEIKQHLVGKQLNVSIRNFPESVNQLRAKWKIKEGGNSYCFFTTNCLNEKIVIFGIKTKNQ